MMIKPHRNIGPDYLHRWHLIPKNRFFNIYLHKFLRSDDDRALHDHPWYSLSILLKGELLEELPDSKFRAICKATPIFRKAKHAHRIELISETAWTLFITGPVIRKWGFHTREGWVNWKKYLGLNYE